MPASLVTLKINDIPSERNLQLIKNGLIKVLETGYFTNLTSVHLNLSDSKDQTAQFGDVPRHLRTKFYVSQSIRINKPSLLEIKSNFPDPTRFAQFVTRTNILDFSFMKSSQILQFLVVNNVYPNYLKSH